MTADSVDGRADATRRHLVSAAAHQFARRPYHDVGLDDILAEARLTKGALYFHFDSKSALALAIIDKLAAAATAVVQDLVTRGLSGLETLIDFSFLIAAQDIESNSFRAGLNLIESVGQSEGRQERLFSQWIQALAVVVERAVGEGDISDDCQPVDVGRMMLSLHMGLRKVSNLDEPERFLLDVQKCWALLLNGILEPDRTEYFTQFLRRRTALAINASTKYADCR